jgi:hypothetical protein
MIQVVLVVRRDHRRPSGASRRREAATEFLTQGTRPGPATRAAPASTIATPRTTRLGVPGLRLMLARCRSPAQRVVHQTAGSPSVAHQFELRVDPEHPRDSEGEPGPGRRASTRAAASAAARRPVTARNRLGDSLPGSDTSSQPPGLVAYDCFAPRGVRERRSQPRPLTSLGLAPGVAIAPHGCQWASLPCPARLLSAERHDAAAATPRCSPLSLPFPRLRSAG